MKQMLFLSFIFISLNNVLARDIYIFGEVHQSLSSKDQTCYQRSLKLINMAKEGKIILGLEGLTPSDAFRLKGYNSSLPESIKITNSDLSNKVFPLEETISYDFAAFFNFYQSLLIRYTQNWNVITRNMSIGIARFSQTTKSIHNIFLETAKKNQSLGKSWRKLQAINEGTLLPNNLQKEDMGMVLELLSQVNDKILEEFSLISPTSPSSIKNISHVIFEMINTQGSTPQSYNDFLYQYIDLPREKSFIKSTLQKIQNDNSNKPIAILVGYEHVERVYNKLTKVTSQPYRILKTKSIDPKKPKTGCLQSLGLW